MIAKAHGTELTCLFVGLRIWILSLLLIAFLAVASAPLAKAGVIPGRWEKVDGLANGTPLRVVLQSEESFEGIFQSSTDREIEVLLIGAQLKTIPKTAIRRIETRYKIADSVANGLAIGAGVGLLIGGLSVAQGNGAGDFGGAGSVILSGLMGTGVGYLVDKAKESPEVLYTSK